jgi:hypothetical protein
MNKGNRIKKKRRDRDFFIMLKEQENYETVA